MRYAILTVLCTMILALWSAASAASGGTEPGLRELLLRAEGGDAIAQTYLGLKYDLGDGVPQDYETAVHWYEKAAEQGIADSQFYLGAAYAEGRGVPQNYLLSHVWLTLAAAKLIGSERETVAVLLNRVARELRPTQIAPACQIARERTESYARSLAMGD